MHEGTGKTMQCPLPLRAHLQFRARTTNNTGSQRFSLGIVERPGVQGIHQGQQLAAAGVAVKTPRVAENPWGLSVFLLRRWNRERCTKRGWWALTSRLRGRHPGRPADGAPPLGLRALEALEA
jgi:hypothetical protein